MNILKISLLHVVVLLFVGCTLKEHSNLEKHIVKSHKLSTVMRSLDLVVYAKEKSELEKDDLKKRYALTLAAAIKKLSLEANSLIPTNSDKKLFKSYNAELYKKAQNIENIANSY
ncbi:MAG: hypothetical protein U9N42_03815, partial [Campylobacterota bacterium]|nr:hypothetical protein [Campylobacterota bacterium]